MLLVVAVVASLALKATTALVCSDGRRAGQISETGSPGRVVLFASALRASP